MEYNLQLHVKYLQLASIIYFLFSILIAVQNAKSSMLWW